jgi:glycosyltransferase involved in cell wall biosynthesis
VTRALLVCPEPLGHGQPAGIGIRFVEMAGVLRADGHQVTLLSPDDGPISPEALRDASAESDVAVVQGHVANDFFAHARPIPTAIDLYDPFIIENLHYYAERGAEVFAHDHATLLRSVERADIFLCASEAQRLFYLGLLLAAGRLNPAAFASDPSLASLLRIAPFGVQAPRAPVARELGKPAILFGGIYDWYDPLLAIDAVALARREFPSITLTFTRHPNPALTPQGKTAAAMEHVRRKGYDFVRFEPWVAYDQRGAWFEQFAAALLTFPQSLETDLSMRTRVYDYLWGGLPIVSSSAPGTDELLVRYGAGAIVRGESAPDYAAALGRVLHNHEEMARGAQRFAEEHQWRRVLQPLVDFVRAPRFERSKDAFGVKLSLPEQAPSVLDRIKRRVRRVAG